LQFLGGSLSSLPDSGRPTKLSPTRKWSGVIAVKSDALLLVGYNGLKQAPTSGRNAEIVSHQQLQ